MSSDEELALIFLALEDDIDETRSKRRKVHVITKRRRKHREFHTLMPQLRKDRNRFYNYFRMTIECFDEILDLISCDIKKSDTNWRECIAPEERLAVALRYLATGDTFAAISHSFCMGFTTVSEIINEVFEAICNKMEQIYLPEPTMEIWQKSAQGFQEVWHFPNCLGTIDGKYVTIKRPDKTGSNFSGHLHKFSVVLMTIVGPDYKFLCVDIGEYGKNSDGGIFEASNVGKKFESNLMNVPAPKNLPGQIEACPHVIIGDEAFALKPYLMRPFPHKQSRHNPRKENYNVRLCRARRVVENAFGILAQKFCIFLRPIQTKMSTTLLTVKAACILHNFLIEKKCDANFYENLEPSEYQLGTFSNLGSDAKRATNLAFSTRELFVEHFNV